MVWRRRRRSLLEKESKPIAFSAPQRFNGAPHGDCIEPKLLDWSVEKRSPILNARLLGEGQQNV